MFDITQTNVALLKPVTSSLSSGIYTDATGAQYTPSMGNDHNIDMDNATGNMANFPCDGSGWWQVDLGGVYNLSSIIFWNNYPFNLVSGTGNALLGANAIGAEVSYLNNYGLALGYAVLNGSAIQRIPVVINKPTPSITASPSGTASSSYTPSASSTASISASTTASPSVTPTNTATGSASLSSGSTPSSTPT